MGRRWTTTLPLVTVAATVIITGCATVRRSETSETEQLLAAAGFKMQRTDVADGQLEATPPYRLVSRTRDGTVEYVYADPDNCRCKYVGGPSEYAEYERLKAKSAAKGAWPPCDYEGLCWPW